MAEDAASPSAIDSLPPVLGNSLRSFIDASYPTMYVNERVIDCGSNIGFALGGAALAIGQIDFLANSFGNSQVSPDQQRNEAQTRMRPEIDELAHSLSRNPDEISVCREISSETGRCVTETYAVRSQDGVVRFSKDELTTSSDLKPAELSALTTALPEPTGNRTATFDDQLIAGLNKATEAYVATLPDQPRNTTNANTGELSLGGASIILIAAGLAKWLKARHTRQTANIKTAYANLDALHAYRVFPDHAEDSHASHERLEQLKTLAGFRERQYARYAGGYIDGPTLMRGGRKARQAHYAALEKAIKPLTEESKVG